MLSQCAKLSCSIPFRCLRQGKLYAIDLPVFAVHRTGAY